MDVKTLLINTLSSVFVDYPILLQGSLSDSAAYPDHFFTFFNNGSNDGNFFDNNETITIWDFDLNIYSIDPEVVNNTLVEAKRLLKSVGFIIDGKGYDVMSDEPTHTGRGINLLYIERYGE